MHILVGDNPQKVAPQMVITQHRKLYSSVHLCFNIYCFLHNHWSVLSKNKLHETTQEFWYFLLFDQKFQEKQACGHSHAGCHASYMLVVTNDLGNYIYTHAHLRKKVTKSDRKCPYNLRSDSTPSFNHSSTRNIRQTFNLSISDKWMSLGRDWFMSCSLYCHILDLSMPVITCSLYCHILDLSMSVITCSLYCHVLGLDLSIPVISVLYIAMFLAWVCLYL